MTDKNNKTQKPINKTPSRDSTDFIEERKRENTNSTGPKGPKNKKL